MRKKRIGTKPFKRLMAFVRRINIALIDQWHVEWNNTIDEKDIRKSDKELHDMAIRTHIKWLIEDYTNLYKDDPKKVDQLFASIYSQIESSKLTSSS